MQRLGDIKKHSRRDVIAAAASGAASMFVARVSSTQPAGDPHTLRSSNGLLKTTLRVVRARNRIGADEVELRSYNGQLVGPTIRVKPGDRLEITLVNELAPRSVGAGSHDANAAGGHGAHMDHHGYNATNLHTHGLHVSPSSPADNVLISVLPKGSGPVSDPSVFVGSYEYKYDIPADHRAGTHWYHSHLHGATSIQLASGMAGALIVEGGLDDIAQIKAARERIFLFQQIPFKRIAGKPGVVDDEDIEDLVGRFNGRLDPSERTRRFTTTNGTVPVVRIRKGAVERWRLIHGGIFETLPIDVVGCEKPYDPNAPRINDFCTDGADAPSSDGIAFYPIALDGIALGSLNEIKGQPLRRLDPGNRMDVLVKALREGTYILRKTRVQNLLIALNAQLRLRNPTVAEDAASAVREDPYALAVIVVEPGTEDMALPAVSAVAALRPPNLNLNLAKDVSHRIRFVRGAEGTVNDRAFTPGQFPRTLILGNTERWEVEGVGEPHPFHIHVNPFQVVEVNSAPVDPPQWLDTIMVSSNQRVAFVTRYDDFTGKFVLHCHNLIHEDIGMMELVEVIPKPPGALHGLTLFQPDTAPKADWFVLDKSGAKVGKDAFRNRAVLLYLWSAECGGCGDELRALAALQVRLGNPRFAVAAVLHRADAAAAAAALAAARIGGLAAYGDAAGTLPVHFGADRLPAAILLDREGHARGLLKAAVEWNAPDVAGFIQYFLEN
jgi:FtsP/CotA-like multicopper oxidase with cupredoxin domain